MCSCSDVLVASGVALAHATRSEPVRMQPVANPSDGYGRFHVATRALGWGGALAARCDSGESAWMCSRLDVLGVGKARNHRAKTRSRTVADTSQCAAESDALVARVVHVHNDLDNAYYWRTLKQIPITKDCSRMHCHLTHLSHSRVALQHASRPLAGVARRRWRRRRCGLGPRTILRACRADAELQRLMPVTRALLLRRGLRRVEVKAVQERLQQSLVLWQGRRAPNVTFTTEQPSVSPADPADFQLSLSHADVAHE